MKWFEDMLAAMVYTAVTRTRARCCWTNEPCQSAKAHRAVQALMNDYEFRYGHERNLEWMHSLLKA